MKSKAKPATKAERERFDALRLIGCLCCRSRGAWTLPAEIHHLLSGNRRRGHEFTIPLCPWHHRGKVFRGMTAREMTEDFGPSLALGSKPFHAAFGSDEELLAAVNELLAQRRAA